MSILVELKNTAVDHKQSRYDLSLIYAREKFAYALANKLIVEDGNTDDILESKYLLDMFTLAFNEYNTISDEDLESELEAESFDTFPSSL